jgi:hypothetical protein
MRIGTIQPVAQRVVSTAAAISTQAQTISLAVSGSPRG